jgi:hypothetical protein
MIEQHPLPFTGIAKRQSLIVLLLVALLALTLQGCDKAGLAVGDTAPAFTLPTSTGGSVSLADYKGQQPVLLYFHMALG